MTRFAPTQDDRASHARARETLAERAREYMQRLGREPNPRERFWFVVDAFQDDLYRPGESAPVLAEVWGFAVNTIEHTACKVKDALGDPARLEDARSHIALESKRRSDILWERSLAATDRDAAALAQASGAEMDRYGKVTGAVVSAGPTVNVAIDARTGQLRPEVQAAVEERVAKLTDAFSRAAARLGHTPDEWRAALAAELDAPALPETT